MLRLNDFVAFILLCAVTYSTSTPSVKMYAQKFSWVEREREREENVIKVAKLHVAKK